MTNALHAAVIAAAAEVNPEEERCAQCDCALDGESYGDGYCRECFFTPCDGCGSHSCCCDVGGDE